MSLFLSFFKVTEKLKQTRDYLKFKKQKDLILLFYKKNPNFFLEFLPSLILLLGCFSLFFISQTKMRTSKFYNFLDNFFKILKYTS